MVIQPRKNFKRIEELLTNHQIEIIQGVLDRSCTGDVCLSKSQLFEELRVPLKLDIEKYQFERAITAAIRNKKIVGFSTRSGRAGGICREDAFSNEKKIWYIDYDGGSYGPNTAFEISQMIGDMLKKGVSELKVRK